MNQYFLYQILVFFISYVISQTYYVRSKLLNFSFLVTSFVIIGSLLTFFFPDNFYANYIRQENNIPNLNTNPFSVLRFEGLLNDSLALGKFSAFSLILFFQNLPFLLLEITRFYFYFFFFELFINIFKPFTFFLFLLV